MVYLSHSQIILLTMIDDRLHVRVLAWRRIENFTTHDKEKTEILLFQHLALIRVIT